MQHNKTDELEMAKNRKYQTEIVLLLRELQDRLLELQQIDSLGLQQEGSGFADADGSNRQSRIPVAVGLRDPNSKSLLS